MTDKNSHNIKPCPILFYFGILAGLSAFGLLISAYLSISHYRVYTDIGYSSFCAISKAINCDTVSQSPYSIFLGVPVPIWGVIGYIFFLITLFLSYDNKSKKIFTFLTLFIIAAIFSAISIFLGILSAVNIQSYCINCIITYGINFLLLYMVWLTKQRFHNIGWRTAIKKDYEYWKSNIVRVVKFYLPLAIFILAALIFIPDYWHETYLDAAGQNIATGITDDGSPWIGAETPELTIIEYADYMCFQCKKMHFFLRRFIAQYPNKIRLIHKHFPMDKKFNPTLKENLHPGSGILSSIAVYAVQQDKFWKLNDYLYNYDMTHKAIYLRKIAEESGLELNLLKTGIHSPEVKIKLQRDIISGLKKNISGTPTYIINDEIYIGQIPPEILKSITK